MDFLEPTGLEADDTTKLLHIEWSDGHTSKHSLANLRRLCPCAECKGEWGIPGKVGEATEMKPEQTDLADIRQVGRYGLTPIWADGHSTGIYTYQYLRKNCECDDCRAGRPPLG
ncbi:MAG: gamma-butyrobetaine hydroxylase-like domain-containing protein [Chloroflexia bacterium]